MWKSVWNEVREILLLITMVGGISLFSVVIAAAAMALGHAQSPLALVSP